MSRPELWSMLLAVSSISLYHLSLKGMPQALNPAAATIAAYAVGTAICLAVMRWVPGIQGSASLRHLAHPFVLGLGLSVAGIELGFLWVYRSGWKVGLAPLVANAAATAVLTASGYLLFRETLTGRQFLGIAVSLGGLWLIARG